MIEIDGEITYSTELAQAAFGLIEKGPNTGCMVWFSGGLMRNYQTGELFEGVGVAGVITGHSGDKVLLTIHDGFIGWIPKKSVRLLNVTIPDNRYSTVH